jgi:chromate transport protein ChrA
MTGVPPERSGLAGGALNTAMEVGPPLGLTVLVELATAHSRNVATGYAFALRAAAVAFIVTALIALRQRSTQGEMQ